MHIHKWDKWKYTTRKVHSYLMGEYMYTYKEVVRYRHCVRCNRRKIRICKD